MLVRACNNAQPPAPAPQEVVRSVPMPQDGVFCGRITRFEPGVNRVFLVIDEKVFEVSAGATIVSHFPRVEHSMRTAQTWLTVNQGGSAAISVSGGTVQGVILHPAE